MKNTLLGLAGLALAATVGCSVPVRQTQPHYKSLTKDQRISINPDYELSASVTIDGKSYTERQAFHSYEEFNNQTGTWKRNLLTPFGLEFKKAKTEKVNVKGIPGDLITLLPQIRGMKPEYIKAIAEHIKREHAKTLDDLRKAFD